MIAHIESGTDFRDPVVRETINALIDRINAWDGAKVQPSNAGSVRAGSGESVIIALDGFFTKEAAIQNGLTV